MKARLWTALACALASAPWTAPGAAPFTDENWTSMGVFPGADGDVRATAVDASGRLYISGTFTRIWGLSASNIAMWDGSNWSSSGSGVNGAVYALAKVGNDVYAGGIFTTAGGTAATNIAKWNGTRWSAVGPGMNNSVLAFAVSGGTLYAGGAFTKVGAATFNGLARWNGSAWSPLGSGVWNGTSQGYVYGWPASGATFTPAGSSVPRVALQPSTSPGGTAVVGRPWD